MPRLNLYNYRAQELFYRRLRVYFLFVMALFTSLLINVLIYTTYQIKILFQQTRNSFLMANLTILQNHLASVNDFNIRVAGVKKQLKLLNSIEDQRDDTVAFFQQLGKIVPPEIYFTSMDWVADQVKFSGVSTSPLYLADFLDKLRDKNGVFSNTELHSNNVANTSGYSFEITAKINADLVAERDGKD